MRRMRRILSILVAGATMGLLAGVSQAGIQNTSHDFSALNWSSGQICMPCHTPHGAKQVDSSGNPLKRLWNHTVNSAQTYKQYQGSTTVEGAEIDSSSLLCLSCHDGTIALDSFGGATDGTHFITGDANLGTDLRTSHPIGKQGTYVKASSVGQPWTSTRMMDPATLSKLRLTTLSDGAKAVGCGTCHNVHNSYNLPYMLRVEVAGTTTDQGTTVNGSALCLSCHIK